MNTLRILQGYLAFFLNYEWVLCSRACRGFFIFSSSHQSLCFSGANAMKSEVHATDLT
jgi:hypothetical protein